MQCDGKWPECNRCKGYGYQCVYGAGKRNYAVVESSTDSGAAHGQKQNDLRDAIRQYEALLDVALSKLASPKQREDAIAVLARMKAADRALSDVEGCVITEKLLATASGIDSPSPRPPVLQAERFLGEVSDVRFFNLVKQVIQNQLGSAEPNQRVDSYEQDGDIPSPNVIPSRIATLPTPEKATAFTEVYFSTVHLAFPFIPQVPFMRSLEQAQNSPDNASLDNTTLALMRKRLYSSIVLWNV